MRLVLLCLIVLTSCGPGAKLRRANRLINEAIAAGAVVKADTVYVDKIIPGDTTVIEVPVEKLIRKDTTIYQDKIKITWRVKHDTLRMTVECPPDTVRVPVTVTRTIVAPPCPKDRFWKGVGFGAAGVLILLILLALIRAIRG